MLAMRGEKLLAMYRKRNGKEYWVFIGGGVEDGESVEAAAIREAREETGLDVKPQRLVYRCHYDDGSRQDFYLCEVGQGEPCLLGDSPEAKEDDPETNVHVPCWTKLSELPKLLFFPLEVRDWVIEDAPRGWEGVFREESFRVAELRREI